MNKSVEQSHAEASSEITSGQAAVNGLGITEQIPIVKVPPLVNSRTRPLVILPMAPQEEYLAYVPSGTKEVQRPIDWNYWRIKMQTVPQWVACALSLNINPQILKGSPDEWLILPENKQIFADTGILGTATLVEFERRELLVACSVSSIEHFTIAYSPGCSVRLDEFAAWCLFSKLKVPSDLEVMAKKQSGVEAPILPVPRFAAQEAAILSEITKQGYVATKLPAYKLGESSVKSSIKAALVGKHPSFPKIGNQFVKAWQRLLDSKEVVNKSSR